MHAQARVKTFAEDGRDVRRIGRRRVKAMKRIIGERRVVEHAAERAARQHGAQPVVEVLQNAVLGVQVVEALLAGEIDVAPVGWINQLNQKIEQRREPLLSRADGQIGRSEEHTSELQSLAYLVCRLL